MGSHSSKVSDVPKVKDTSNQRNPSGHSDHVRQSIEDQRQESSPERQTERPLNPEIAKVVDRANQEKRMVHPGLLERIKGKSRQPQKSSSELPPEPERPLDPKLAKVVSQQKGMVHPSFQERIKGESE